MSEDNDPRTDLLEAFGLQPDPVWDEQQEQAIDACCDLSKRIVAVTGEAGTGKTMLIKEAARRL